jgi:asparagine synthase (glutamine-hydrolysing)
MCGFAGLLDFRRDSTEEQLRSTVTRMRDTLITRGPDDAGIWLDESSGIAFGHRRLSIIDLSPLGHQPMTSSNGRYVVAYNGEVYNYADIRRDLENTGTTFRGHSDTEVLLAAVEAWGVERALPRFNGMFAIALWDRAARALFLARDRFGEKPLYYGRVGTTFVFGSELKALRAHPAFANPIDRASLREFVRFSCVPGARTIYEGIHKLLPGTWLRVREQHDAEAVPSAYWSAADVARRGATHRFAGNAQDATDALDKLLQRAVSLRMISDVPLGAFLSGGIDSSAIVALMQNASAARIRTFTIGFSEEGYNEAGAAKQVATHLGTDHTELYVSAEQAREVIPMLPRMYDEPFADSSQIPTHLVCALARRQVTVALSGDAGDELFGGYNRYAWTNSLWRAMRMMPRASRRAVASVLTSVSTATWDAVLKHVVSVAGRTRVPLAGDKVHKLATVLAASDALDLYVSLLSTWHDPATIVRHTVDEPVAIQATLSSLTEEMMLFDTQNYLPNDILVKVDRAAMAVSLETRVPFLDPDVFAFAWSLPLKHKVRAGVGKVILRSVLARYLPRRLFERPKMGFGVPIDAWLRGPLRDWCEELLSEERLRRDDYFEPRLIRLKWRQHLDGTRNWQHQLWPILMFQAWCQYNSGKPESAARASSALRA